MNLIYLVVSIILGTISWVTTQFSWQYAYILEYIFLFLTGWYICLFLFHQDEFDRSKTYNLLTPIHLIYTVIMIVSNYIDICVEYTIMTFLKR